MKLWLRDLADIAADVVVMLRHPRRHWWAMLAVWSGWSQVERKAVVMLCLGVTAAILLLSIGLNGGVR